MVTRTEAIKRFLLASTHDDLAAIYNHNMEVQVNVAQGNGDRKTGEFKGRKWHGFTDGIETWKSFRIPYKANTEPEYEDKKLQFNFEKHVEGIGMTGWDWSKRQSLWVAYDFDAIVGHSDKHEKKLTESELKQIKDIVMDIPWVEIRYSTSGKGLHLYVHLTPVMTRNHNEHAALARAILGRMSAITGYNFCSKVDVCGGNMWVWHRKMKGDGLRLIKAGTKLTEIPDNWQDHIKVVSGKRKKSIPSFIEESDKDDLESLFDELSGQRPMVKLDEEHKKLIAFLQDSGSQWWWDQDHHMLVTHTIHLREAHESLNYKGIFKTISSGKDRGGDHNCFCYPLRKGAWAVRRYTPGTQEESTWDQDGNGWTRCYLNKQPDLRTACRTYGGIEDTDGSYVFREAEMAAKAAKMVGVNLLSDLHSSLLSGRETKLKEHKDGRLIVNVNHDAANDHHIQGMAGWLVKQKKWQKVYNQQVTTPEEAEVGNYDDIVRHLVTEAHEDYGWVLKVGSDAWRREPLTHVSKFLNSIGLNGKECTQVIGSCVARCWTLVNRPFQPEYIGDRKWNRNSAQLRFSPEENIDNLQYPTWMMVLQHCGHGLDEVIKEHPWAKANGISTGADYLKCWLASLIQEPTEPLPYLFFYSREQSTGKSTFHEAIEMLMTCGVERADAALINQSGFNAEIEHAVLCVVEEVDLNRNRQAYNRIKDWVTSRKVSIHRKGQTPYSIVNTTHWIQCANDPDYCPVFQGDSRITMIQVPVLDPLEMMPKKELFPLLEKEAPHFLTEILKLEVPHSHDRLNVPVIETEEKKEAALANRTYLEMFLDECCHYVTGREIKFSVFYDRFMEWLPPEEHHRWSKIKVGRELPKDKYPKGRLTSKDSQFYVGNISWEPIQPGEKEIDPYVCKDNQLVPK